MRFQKFFFLILVLFFALQNSFGQSVQNTEVDALKYFDENKRWYNEFTEHWFNFYDIPESEIRDSIAQFDKIGKDLRNPENEWEGTYGNGGDTHGSYLRWSEKNGFILLVINKCNGGPTQIKRGKVVVTSSLVRLIPEKIVTASFHHRSHSKKTHNKPVEFLFVKWRGKKFLIFSDQIINFADYTAGLNPETSGLYDEGWYFSEVLKEENGSANELPIFPIGYENYVKKPFKGEIISVEKTFRRNKPIPSKEEGEYFLDFAKNYEDLVSEVKINLGKSSGIYPKVVMRFVSDEDSSDYDRIVITKVFGNYSIGEYVSDTPKKNCQKSDTEDCKPAERKSLKKGIKLSTTGR